MQVHPDIAALRSNPALQRQAHQEMSEAYSAWKESEAFQLVKADLKAFEEGASFADCNELMRLLSDLEFAQGFVGAWRDALLEPLRAQPLANIPSRHSISHGLTTIQLMVVGSTTLSLLAYEERADLAEPTSALFVDRDLHEIVLAGGAQGTRNRLKHVEGGSAEIVTQSLQVQPGWTASYAPRIDARQVTRVAGSMLVLQLTRTPTRPAPSRLYSIPDGNLLQQTSGNKRASQNFLALDVLGAMGRDDAVPAMAELALAAEEEADLRWEAVRQVLGLDAAQGMALLGQLAEREADGLATPARSLQQSLIEANAQLARFAKENTQCPA